MNPATPIFFLVAVFAIFRNVLTDKRLRDIKKTVPSNIRKLYFEDWYGRMETNKGISRLWNQ